MVTNFYGIFKCCWLKNTFKHTVLYALAIWFGAMNAANAGTGDETLPRYSGEAFNSGVIHILPNDIVINSKIVVNQNSSIEIQLNNYNISAELDETANHLFLVENDGVLILSGKEPAAEEFKTADKNSVTAGNNTDILNVNGGLVKLSNITLKDSKTAAIITNSAIFQTINASFANMNSGAVKNAGNATFSGKNDFVDNSVATGNGGALNLEKESETKFSDSSLFENNSAANGKGGAIYGDGSLYFGDQNKLISAVFTNNTAIDGGAVFVDENGKFVGYGEFIFGQDSAANGNKATNSGGAIYNKGQMSFVGFNGKETKSIMFAANQATNGGAIYNTGALNLNGQQSFISNSALYNGKDDTKGFGGAIYNTGTLDIYGTDVKFSNNTAQKAGGAIYNNGGVVNISGSGILFNNNKVLETGKVDFVNWKNDAKEGFGGAIANMEGSRLNISGNVTFSENGKEISGGGAVYNRGYMTISGTRITEDGRDTTDSYNHAAASILFEKNVASKGIGGAIEAKGLHSSGKNTVALSVIRGANFIGNSSNAEKAGDSRAGAIRANNDSITILDNVVFKGNSSRAAGGAISTANNLKDSALGTFISISNAYFEGNSVNMVGADGGAIRTGGALSMTNVQFVNNENKNDLDGAALSFDGTSLLLVADNGNVLFKGNIAKKGLADQSSSGIHIDGKDAKKIMFNAGNGGEVVFFDKIVNKGTDAGANLTLELNKSNVLNATSTQLEQIYAKFFDTNDAYIGPNSKDDMQKTILGAKSVYWLSKEEAAAAGRLEEWNNLHEVEGIKTAPTDGKIIFNTQISDTSLNLHNGELLLADEITDEIKDKPYIVGNSNLNLYGGKLDVSNNNIESKDQLAFNKINVEGETELNLDIDILNNKIDYLGKDGITGTDKGKLVISEIGILNEAPTSLSLGGGSEKLFKFTGRNGVKTELSGMTQVIVTSKAGYYFTLGKVDGSDQNNAVRLYKVLSGGGLGVALDSGSEFGISMKQSGGVETVNWAEKYNIYDPKTGKTYSNMFGTNVQKGAVFTLKGEKESVVKAGDGENNKVGIVAGTKKFGADGKVYTLAMNDAANDIKDRETSAGRNTWYTYNKNETTGIREKGDTPVTDMSGTTGQNLNISNIKFEGFKTAITNYETGVVNLENVGFSSNALDIYNLGMLNLKGENTFTNGIGGKDSLGKMSIINGKTISNSEINQQNVTINDIASLTVDADHLKSVTTNNGELNLGKGTLAYEVTGVGKTYISAGTEENKTKFSLADNVTIKQNSFSVLKNANAENVKGGKIIADNIKIAESGALSTKVGEHLQGNIDNHGTLTLYGSGDKSVTELFNNALVDSYGEKTGKLVIDENANIKATEKINQNTMVNNGTFYADINKLAIEDKNSGIINDGVLYLNGSATNEAAAQNNLITTVSGNGVLYLSNNVVNTQNITQKEIHLIDKANVEAENDSSLKAKIKLDEGTKLAIKAENLISNKPSDKIDENWIDVENEGSLDLSGNLLDVVIGKAEDKEKGGLVNINSSISLGEKGEIRNNTVNINNNGVGLTVNADKITNSVIYVNDNSLTLTGGTLNSNVNGGKTNINGDVVLASSSNIASSAVNVAENKSLTIAAGRSWNNAISGKGTTIFGADFDGSNKAVIETLLINNGLLTSNTANIKGNVSNNNKLTLNGNNDVFNNTITGSGDLTLNGVMTANKTISQKSITNNGTLNSSIDNLNGELINTNTGIFNVAGANVVLNKNIAGEGTTVLENEAILKFGDSGKIEGVLKTNGATLDLQDTANKYTDVKIGAISGDLKLKIDADLSNASSDALELTSSKPSNGNIILSSINVQKDGDKSVTFLKGNTSGITSKLDTASTISTITNDYTYTFGISGNNKLDVLSAVLNTKPNTLKDFVTGNLAISANTYSMTKDISITSAENDNFGTTAGANTELNLNLNGHNLYGTLNGAKKDGIAVGNGYTLNINGTDGTVRGNISGFDNALKVENGGTLNIANTVLNNDTDINNQGTLYADNISANKVLTTSNAVIKNSNITDLENKGTAALKGTNALTNITETGNLIVNDGKTTVLGKLEQNRVTVANNAVLEAVLDKFVVSSNTINNGVLNLFGNGAINKDITGKGSLNLDGIVDNNAAITQKDLTLASGKFTNSGTISVVDSMNVNGDITNNGSVSAKDLIVSGNFANKANAAINGVLTLKENAAATAENNGVITGGVIVENNRILTNNNLVSGKVNVVNNGKILGNSGVMNITEPSENNGEINQHKFTISNTGGFVNKGVLISAVLENNNNLINSNKITAAMLKNNGNIDNTSGTIEGVITNENIINGGKIIANDGSVNNKTINADLTSKGKFTNKGNIAGTITNTGSFKNAGIIKGNITNNGDLTSAIENIMGTVINNGTYKTSGGIMNYDINGAGNTEINGNVVMGAGMFGANQSVNITAGSLLDIGAKTVSLNNLKLNGTLGLEITSIANKSSDYFGGKLLVNNADLSGGKIQFTVDQGLLNKKEQTGDLSIISLKSGASGSVVGDLTKVFEKNNRYEIIQGTKKGTVIIKNIASSSDVASLVGNRNNRNTAAAWENATLTSGTEAADIQKALDRLSQHNAQGYRRALNELAPSDSQMNLETVRLVQNIIGRETGKRFEKGECSLYRPASMWVKGIGASHYMDNRFAAQGFNADTAGYVMGYDGNVDCDTSVGLGYAYTNTDTKGNINSRKSSISAQNMFVYGKYQPKLTYIRGAFIYGLADYDDKTSVAGYGISSKYNMHSIGAETALGHEYQNGLNPETGLRYTHLMPNDYTDSIGQKVENENITAISAFAKLKYKAEVKTDNQILFKPAIYIGANYDLNNSSHKINVAVANSRYTISSEPMSRFGFNGGLELAVSHDNVDLILGYDLNLHTKYSAHSGQIQFRYNF